MDQLE